MMMENPKPEPAPAPYTWGASGLPGGNGLFNLYIMDANGRKIGAVWGKPGEKERTAALFSAAPVMHDALVAARLALPVLKSMLRAAKLAGVDIAQQMIDDVDAAIALADGRDKPNGGTNGQDQRIEGHEAAQTAQR